MKQNLRKLALLALSLACWAPLQAQNLALNGNFTTYPTPVGQTLNLAPGTDLGSWVSSVQYAGTGIYPEDTRVSVQLGGVQYFNNVVQQGIFPGDPVWNVPSSLTWLYSNGNNTGAPYTIWNETVPLQPNAGYYFACYTSNAIVPGRIAEQDPQLELIVNNDVFGSFRVFDDADPLSGHGGLDLWDRRQIFFRSGTSTSARLSLRDSQLSTFGDDFALTSVTVTANLPPVANDIRTSAIPQNSPSPVGILPLVANDPDGNNTFRQPAPYTLLTVPTAAQGVLTLAGSSTPLVAGRTLTTAEISQLQFRPTTGFVGDATFTYRATDEGDLNSNTATYTIPVSAAPAVDLAISKQVFLGPYRAGSRTTFTVRVANLSATTPATGVIARDQLPAGLTLVSATPNTGSFNAGTGVWTIGNLAAGASATLLIVATTELASTGTTNVATVSGNEPDAVPANNRASRTIYPGATYADDFEGRILPDYCVGNLRLNINNATQAPISGSVSYITDVLTPPGTDAFYRTPLLRLTGSTLLTFNTELLGNGAPGSRNYTVNLIDANNAQFATLRPTTAYSTAGSVINESINITQTGVFKIEIRFATTNPGGTLRAVLDDVLVRGANVAARAKDGSDCTTNQLPLAVEVTNFPPIPNGAGPTTILPLLGTDPDGTVVAFTIASVPDSRTQGVLSLDGVPVQVGQEISSADASRLTFDPLSTLTRNVTFRFFAIDDSGESSISSAIYTILVVTGPLPVELVAFDARADGPSNALLTWATASEKNSAQFEVERSVDGRTFVRAGTVAAAGNSTTRREYRYVDANAVRYGRRLYYRLHQVDRDGMAEYSPVRTVSFGASEGAVSLYPNPTASDATLDLTALPTGTYTVTLYTLTGQKVGSTAAPGGQLTPLDTQTLAAGAYVVRISGNGTQLTRRLVKLP